MLIVALLLLPTAVATFLLSQVSSRSIEFAEKEVAGSRYLQPVMELHLLIGEHRAAALSSLLDREQELPANRIAIREKLSAIDTISADMKSMFDVDQSWSDARAAIVELLSLDKSVSFGDAMADHETALGKLTTHANIVGDYSNLILDPDLDSYYLMDAVLLKIPPFLDALDTHRVNFIEQSGQFFFQQHKFELITLNEKAEATLQSIETAISHNGVLDRTLASPLNDFSTRYQVSLESLNATLNTPDKLTSAEVYQSISVALNSGAELFNAANTELQKLLQARIDKDVSSRNTMLIYVLLAVAAGCIFTFIVGRSITLTIVQAKNIAAAIADDQLDTEICTLARDEPGQLMSALKIMQNKLKDRLQSERAAAISNGRIKQALECVSSVVLVANIDDKLIYCNNAGNEYFRQHENLYSQNISGFELATLLQQTMNIFCGPGETLSSEHGRTDNAAKIIDRTVGDRHIRIIASPVFDEEHRALGTVIELNDRTAEVLVEQAVGDDVLGLVEATLQGNLAGRINAHGKPEFLAPVYNGINEMVSVCNSAIAGACELFQRLANGDLTCGMSLDPGVKLQGDFLKLHNDANTTVEQLNLMIDKVKKDAMVVKACADKVIAANTQLENNTISATEKTRTANEAVNTVSNSVDDIASSAQEMNASIKKIVKNTQKYTSVAKEAVGLTKIADEKVLQLSSSSHDIGAMVKVINSIAEQTNLLALNATIEAARAGDAGKGFAVVANEVKELAKETAKATDDIGDKIRTIQSDSSSAAEGIRAIDSIVLQIDDLQSGNAKAMEEQSTTTQAISRSIDTVAQGTSGISADVWELVESTADTNGAVNVVKSEVSKLDEVATELQSLVDNFKLSDTSNKTTT